MITLKVTKRRANFNFGGSRFLPPGLLGLKIPNPSFPYLLPHRKFLRHRRITFTYMLHREKIVWWVGNGWFYWYEKMKCGFHLGIRFLLASTCKSVFQHEFSLNEQNPCHGAFNRRSHDLRMALENYFCYCFDLVKQWELLAMTINWCPTLIIIRNFLQLFSIIQAFLI